MTNQNRLDTIRYDNVNAPARALDWSTTLDGRRPNYNLARKGRDTEFVPRSTAASTIGDVLAHAANRAGGYSQGDHSRKNTTNPQFKETEDTCAAAANEFISAATSDSSSD